LVLDAVSKLNIAAALRTGQQLREASAPGLSRLETVLADTPCQIILTNRDGIVVYASRCRDTHEELLMKGIARVGVDLSEPALGTTAPGIVMKTGQACAVRWGEHFNEEITNVRCTAAPIHDLDAQLAGVLNISVEGRSFGFDAATLISTYAGMIEYHLVARQSRGKLLLAFQVEPGLLSPPQAGLMVVDEDGRLKWLNEVARRLTDGAIGQAVESVLGWPMHMLCGLREDQPQHLCLPNGLRVWALAHWHPDDRTGTGRAPANTVSDRIASFTGDRTGGSVSNTTCAPSADFVAVPTSQRDPSASPSAEADNGSNAAPSTLRASRDEKISRALAECGGNVARAARLLGVSRGLIYRHRKAAD
jgi:transcriptional regulator of acetoin/glycerol metabolism